MLFPIFTYGDGTEVTASKPDKDGNVSLYVEKFDENKDSFINATFIIPGATLKSSSGYDENTLGVMSDEFTKLQDDIIQYVMDKVKE